MPNLVRSRTTADMENKARIVLLYAIVCMTVVCVAVEATDWQRSGMADIEASLKLQMNNGKAKNIILFIGDGMGLSTITAARILKGQRAGHTGEETVMVYEKFPHIGLSKVYGVDRQVPDSAQTATAMMSGYKTNWYIIGAKEGAKMSDCESMRGQEVDSILHIFKKEGRATGVISTARITHATPASSYAHTVHRDWEGDVNIPSNTSDYCKDIAYQLVHDNDINVVFGGGRRHFLPNSVKDPETQTISSSQRQDNHNLVEEWMTKQRTRSRKHEYIWNREQFDQLDPTDTDYVLGLMASSHMEYELLRNNSVQPSLAELTTKTIQILSKSSNGFFLMVEGARIDHAHHDSTAQKALGDAIALEKAVEAAKNLTNSEDTLIIVTADHSHVFNIGGYPYRGNNILACKPGKSRGLFDLLFWKKKTSLPLLEYLFDLASSTSGRSSASSTQRVEEIRIQDGGHVRSPDSRFNLLHQAIPTGITITWDKNQCLSYPLEEEPTTDGLPFTTLSYGNGPGFHLYANRTNLTDAETTKVEYVQESAVPMSWETHGGEDVAIYASGPMAHLFHGAHEQSYIAYVMQHAACVGVYKTNCKRPSNDVSDPGSASFHIINWSCLILPLCITFLFFR